MISKTAEYALRAVVAVADNDGQPRLAPQIAELTGVPPAYLSKVLQTLVRARIVASQRGLGGGFSLARPAAGITVLDVIDAVDPIERIERCPLGLAGHEEHLCPLHRRLDEAIVSIRSSFGGTSIAELVAENRPALCQPVPAEAS